MRGTWVAVLAAGVIALAACGGTASTFKADNRDVPRLADMLRATEKANTARFDLRTHIEGGFSSPIDGRATGVIDFAKNRGSASLSAQHPPANNDETFEMPVEARWLDGKSYERYDPNAKSPDVAVSAAKPWVLDESNDGCASNDSNSFLGAMVGMPGLQTGPSNLIDELANRGVTLVRSGTESIRGTGTTHWRADISRPATSTTLGGSNDCGDDLAGETPKLELWTDNEYRVRRITMSSGPDLGGGALSVSLTTELYDYGVTVDVTAPPADQIAEATSAGVGGPNEHLSTSNGSASAPNLGAMKPIATGALGKNTWTLKASDDASGGRCFFLEGTPRTSAMMSNGSCFPTGAGMLPVAMIFDDEQAAGQRLLVGLVDPKLPTVKVTLGDGRTETVIAKGGAFAWTGPSTTKIRSITTGSTTCSIDNVSAGNTTTACPGMDTP